MKKIIIAFAAALTLPAFAQKAKTVVTEKQKMDAFIKNLMAKMTVDEKIGQLNLVTGGEATTGAAVSTGVESKIAKGNVGGILV